MMGLNAESSPNSRYLRIGPLLCDRSCLQLRCGNLSVSLTEREFELFWALASQPERLMSRQKLRDSVWHKKSRVDLRTIDLHIAHIRRKVRRFKSSSMPVIQTVWSLGYKMRNSPASNNNVRPIRKSRTSSP